MATVTLLKPTRALRQGRRHCEGKCPPRLPAARDVIGSASRSCLSLASPRLQKCKDNQRNGFVYSGNPITAGKHFIRVDFLRWLPRAGGSLLVLVPAWGPAACAWARGVVTGQDIAAEPPSFLPSCDLCCSPSSSQLPPLPFLCLSFLSQLLCPPL